MLCMTVLIPQACSLTCVFVECGVWECLITWDWRLYSLMFREGQPVTLGSAGSSLLLQVQSPFVVGLKHKGIVLEGG